MTHLKKTPSWLTILLLSGLGISVSPHQVLTRTDEVSSALSPVLSSYEVIRMAPGEIERQVRTTGELRFRFDETDFYFNLEPHDLRTPNYQAVETGPGGVTRTLPREPVHTFKGVLAGREDTRGRFNLVDGGVEGVVYAPEGWVYVEPLRNYLPSAPAGELVVYSHADIKPGEALKCGVSLPKRMQRGVERVTAQVEAATPTKYEFEVATEADYEYVQALGGSEAANREILGILNQVDGVYQSELLLQLRVSFQRAWTMEDPYHKTDKSALLDDFGEHWNDNFAASRIYDVAHLWTGKSLEVYGTASRGVACRFRSSSYGLSTRLTSTPAKYSLTAHEIGHNFGATHPHAYNPPIAGCQGTIMRGSDYIAGNGAVLTFCEFSRHQIARHVALYNDCLTPRPISLQPPSDLTATAVSTSGIDLSWRDRSTNETGFRVQRRPVEGNAWIQIGTVAADATTFSSRGLFPGDTYRYRVQAFNETEPSAFSNEAVATTLSGPLTRAYWKIDTIAGGGVGDNGPAVAALLDYPNGVAVDRAGNLYVADTEDHRIRRIDASGTIITIAGTGEKDYRGDGGPAVEARLNLPEGVAVDSAGNLYIADRGNHCIRRIDSFGIITTIAGTGERGFSGDGGPAVAAQLNFPAGVAVDGSGNLYIADEWNNRIRRVDSSGTITTLAGTGRRGFRGDGGTAIAARLNHPNDVAVDGAANLYIADSDNHRIRRIDSSGTIITIAGTGERGFNGDEGTAASAQLSYPTGMAVDGAGNLVFADTGNNRIRRIDSSGTIATLAGTGEGDFSGDAGPAVAARLDGPNGVAIDSAGNVYIADTYNHRIRRVDSTGTITTIAGASQPGFEGQPSSGGDGGPAVAAQLNSPEGAAIDGAANVYIADTYNHRIRRVDSTGTITTIVGTGEEGFSGDRGPGGAARLSHPSGVVVDDAGYLYIADSGNHRIRRITPLGPITTIAGTGEPGFSGDGGPAVAAQLSKPQGLTLDGAGNLYIADTENHRIRRIDTSGTITTLAGTGSWGFSGDGGPAVTTQLSGPKGVAVDGSGNIYIADTDNRRIRRIDSSGMISTVAGTGETGYGGDYGPAVAARLGYPRNVMVDAAGNLYISDKWNNRIRRVDASGTMTTIAGTGRWGLRGDGGPAVQAWLRHPNAVAADGSGNLYIADTGNHRIRIVTLTTPPTALQAPGGLTATAVSSSEVDLDWQDNSDNETGFRVQRRQGDSDDWVQVGTAATNAATFSDTGLLADTLYHYRVQAFNDTESSAFSNQASVNTSALHPPSGLTATAVSSSGIDLRWQDNSINETGFTVQRQRDGSSDWVPVGTTAANATTFSDAGLLPGTRYRYRVQAFNDTESSAFSNQAVATTRSVYPPRDLTARAVSSSRIDLSWQDNNVNETGFRVQRRQAGSSLWLPIGTTTANATTFLDVGLLFPGTRYHYRVQAFNETESSVFSNEATATTLSGSSTRDSWRIDTISGGSVGDGGPAVAAHLDFPEGVAVDGAGNLYIADRDNHRVRRIDSSGIITTIAGTGERGFSGDGGPAAAAQLDVPEGVAVDGAGNLYIADKLNHRIRRVDSSGIITTIAGTGETGFGGDGGPAINAQLNFPGTIAVDSVGNLYIADSFNHRIRRVDRFGNISTIAGTGEEGYSGDGGPAAAAQLNFPTGVVADIAGNLYIADSGNGRIRRVATSGAIRTIAGTGEEGYSGDDGPAIAARLNYPQGLALDVAGNLYISDSGNHRIRRVDSSGIITTIAGIREGGFGGDGGPAVAAQLHFPSGVAVDSSGNLYIADWGNHRIRRIDSSGTIITIAGTGGSGSSGDGGPAVAAQLNLPQGVAADGNGNLYIADTENHRIRRVDTAGTITTLAGTGGTGYSGDGGPAVAAQLNSPSGVALDVAGNLYIADSENHRIRRIDSSGTIATIAGTGAGFSGDDGPAGVAQLRYPRGIAVDGDGNLYIGDTGNHRIRWVDASGIITTIAGTGRQGFSGDNGLAVDARLLTPERVAVDAAGSVYITDTWNHRIRRVDPSGTITTIAGTGELGKSGDNGPAVAAQFSYPQGVAADGNGNLYIADTGNHRIRRVDATGTITTIAGTGKQGFRGDGGPAVTAQLSRPESVAVDGLGNVYVADTDNHRIRVLTRASTSTALLPPTNLMATAVSRSGVDLAWQDNSTNETGFRVQRRLDGTGDWVVVGTTAANTTIFSDVGLTPGTPYHYRVQALNDTQSSFFSNELSIITAGLAPTVAGFVPMAGPVGTRVTLTGTYFLGATAVRFNRVSAVEFEVVSGTSIEVVVPRRATSGPISVVTPEGTAVSADTFTVVPPPTLTRFTPATGPAGTRVTLTGTHLLGATAVRFNGVSAPEFEVVSGTSIEAVVPSGATSGPISVVTPGGTAVSAEPFTVVPPPTLTRFTPTTGPAGTRVTLTGTHFLGATYVRFNGVRAVEFAVLSGTSIEAVVPSGATSGPISVVTPGGMAVSTEPFMVALPPTLTGFTPTTGPAGTRVTLTGTHFLGATDVRFNGVRAVEFEIVSGTSIEAVVPSGATSGPISVVTPGGTAVSAQPFTVTTVFQSRLFVPVVLRSQGRTPGSFFTSELTLTNRGTTTAGIRYTYSASFGGGSGPAVDFLEAGRQRVIPDAIAYLTPLGVPIGEGAAGRTLKVDFSNLSSESDAAVTVRTSTPVEDGRGQAGLAYLGVTPEDLLTGASVIAGLRQNRMDRSNVAVQNAGDAGEESITLRVTVFSGDPEAPGSQVLPDLLLPPGGFHQYNRILTEAGFENGYVKVERVSGTAAYYAYGVINDNFNSDGSFVFPVNQSSLVGKRGQTLPVIVETRDFTSELTVTNFSPVAKTVDFLFVAEAVETDDDTASFSLRLAAGEQSILPNLVDYLRRQGVDGLGGANRAFAGALFATAAEGDMSGIVIGARTGSSDGGGGQYGVFYNAVPYGSASTGSAWIYGLQQNATNRSNLALVNTGEVDDGESVFSLDIYDGETGRLVRTVTTKAISARGWHQINGILSTYAPATAQGYVQVRKLSGTNPFLAYGVINDGAFPGQRSGDGAFLPSQ